MWSQKDYQQGQEPIWKMANKGNGRQAGRTKRRVKKDLLYFFLDQDLYRIMHINRPANIVTVWDYQKAEFVKFNWTDIQRRAQRAYTTAEVSNLVGRHRTRLFEYIKDGLLPSPKHSYPINNPGHEKSSLRWSEKNIMQLHDVMLTKHYGKPRLDGGVTPLKMPTKAEIQAMLRNETITYIKDEDGEFIPVWKENSW